MQFIEYEIAFFQDFKKNAELNIEVWNPKTFHLFQDVKFYIKLRPHFQRTQSWVTRTTSASQSNMPPNL